MPNWKKIILSGSNASLESLYVSNAVTASAFKGDGSALTGVTSTVTQTATVTDTFTSAVSKTVTHNFNTKNVLVSTYDGLDRQIIPASVTTTDVNSVTVTFSNASSGRVVVAKGGHIVSGSATDSDKLGGNPAAAYATTGSNIFTATQYISGSILPGTNEAYDLGSSSYRWRDIYLSGSTIDLGGTKITKDPTGDIVFKDQSDNLKTLRVAQLEIGTGSKRVRLKLDDNDRLKFEDKDTNATEAPTYYKETISGASTYNITHNLAEDYPIVQIYDNNKLQVLPASIKSTNSNTISLTFDTSFSGVAVVKK